MYLAVRLPFSLTQSCSLVDGVADSASCVTQEDRILCWELVSKRGSAWILHYQRSASAETARLPFPS